MVRRIEAPVSVLHEDNNQKGRAFKETRVITFPNTDKTFISCIVGLNSGNTGEQCQSEHRPMMHVRV